jgi:hypothetical protein
MKKHTLTSVAVVALSLLAFAGCGTSGGSDGEKATTTVASEPGTDAGSGDDAAAEDGFVTGSPDEWLATVCGDDAEISTSTDDPEPRYGPNATELHFCTPPAQPDGNDTYPEAVLFSVDPSADWSGPSEDGDFLSWAIGQVSEDQWALVYEDNSTNEIAEPHLAGLAEFGFEVYENNEKVS